MDDVNSKSLNFLNRIEFLMKLSMLRTCASLTEEAPFECPDALVENLLSLPYDGLLVLSLPQASLCTVTWSVSTEATLKTASSLRWVVSGASPSATMVAGSACSIAQITMGSSACPVLMGSRTFAKRRCAFHLTL